MESEAAQRCGGAKLVAVNVKTVGKVHRLSMSSAALPREERRTICGWRAGGAVSKARFCKTGADAARLCRKCFRDEFLRTNGGEAEDCIEESV